MQQCPQQIDASQIVTISGLEIQPWLNNQSYFFTCQWEISVQPHPKHQPDRPHNLNDYRATKLL